VINLMDALRRSIEAVGPAPAQSKKSRKSVEGQKEMLLPIQGKQASEGKQAPREAAKKPARSSARSRKAG
jgi:DNA end-binding protein Ku